MSAARAGKPTRGGRAWSRIAIVAGFAIAAAAGFYAARVIPRSGAQPDEAPRESATVSPLGAGAVESTPPRPADTGAAATTAPTAEASATPAVTALSSTRPIGAGTVPSKAGGPATRPTRPGSAPPGCSPPYTITADGLREYKPHCLR